MKRTLGILAGLGLAFTMATSSWAVDAKQFGCEKATVVELAKVSRSRGKCIRTCLLKKQAKPGTYTCTPGFDIATQSCADKTVDKYGLLITTKCTDHMPPCGGYEKGFCSNNTATTCNRDIFDCPGTCNAGFCAHDGVTPCTANGDCDGSCSGRCSVTTTKSCSTDADCPGGETCGRAGVPKDIPVFITGNLYDGDPLGPLDQVDAFGEKLFGCRQSVCSGSGDLCGSDTDCSDSSTCTPGKCSDGSLCTFDGQCGTGTTKKCIALGRCSATGVSCRTNFVPSDCPMGETCQRYGRCSGGSNNQQLCFTIADCPDAGGTCSTTTVDTDRKQELKCTTAVSDTLGKYTFDIANCQAKCALERDQKDGQRCTGDTNTKCASDDDCTGIGVCRPTSCDPFAIGRCSNNTFQVCAGNSDCQSPGTCVDSTPDPISATLKACRDLAKSKALAFIAAKCPSLPACGAYSVFGDPIGNFNRPEDLIGFVTGQQDGQFKEDNPDLSPGSNFCLP